MAKEKGNYPEIYDELYRIRRDADDGLTPHVLAESPALCQLLGNGDPFLATGHLRDRLSTAAAGGDRAVLAFFHSIKAGGDATARLGHAGEELHVEYRRARDLSDEGILKLSQILGSDEDWHVPFMGCAVTIIDWEAVIESYVMVTQGFRGYAHPRFLLNDKEVGMPHRRADRGDWERHIYGPTSISIGKETECHFHMRRIGTPKMRINTILRSNNPQVDVTSTLMYLTYALDFTVQPQDAQEPPSELNHA